MNTQEAIEVLGIKGKTELARKLGVTVQSLYKYKCGDLPQKLEYIISLLLTIKNQAKKINDLERVLENKQAIIDELKK